MKIRRRHAAISGVAAFTLVLPALLEASALSTYVLLELTAIVTVGVSLLMGRAGQVSLGQGAFYACGAYVAALVATHGLPTVLGLLAAPWFAACFAVIVGLRCSGSADITW